MLGHELDPPSLVVCEGWVNQGVGPELKRGFN